MSRCWYCQQPVDPSDPLIYRRVGGWERKALDPSRRGGSDITLREHTDMFACPTCVDRERSGVSAAQESLL